MNMHHKSFGMSVAVIRVSFLKISTGVYGDVVHRIRMIYRVCKTVPEGHFPLLHVGYEPIVVQRIVRDGIVIGRTDIACKGKILHVFYGNECVFDI